MKGERPNEVEDEETCVKEFLIHRGFKEQSIIFEPNGPKTFPDFSIDGKIGVEVRRLNKYLITHSGTEQIECLAEGLKKKLCKLLSSFGPPVDEVSWYVECNFRRPRLTKEWEPPLRAQLETIQKDSSQSDTLSINIDDNFQIRLERRKPNPEIEKDHLFTLGGFMDFDAGGWREAEMPESLDLIIQEKTTKRVAAFKQFPSSLSYSEWWLVLVDYMAAGTQRSITMKHDWDKIIVIFPKAYERAYEILKSN